MLIEQTLQAFPKALNEASETPPKLRDMLVRRASEPRRHLPLEPATIIRLDPIDVLWLFTMLSDTFCSNLQLMRCERVIACKASKSQRIFVKNDCYFRMSLLCPAAFVLNTCSLLAKTRDELEPLTLTLSTISDHSNRL